ncbi:MAG: NAD(P)/FAD-dependent oxidoreductase [Alphaproteobacteria bacterium]
MTETLDCLVVGGGPAGLTAAIYLGRFRRRVTCVDKGWSRAEWITKSHNLPGFLEGIAGPALLGAMRAQARRYGAHLQTGVIEAVRRGNDGAFAAHIDGVDILAKTLLLATGVVENRPPLPHLADAVKHGLIRTCPICDGYEAIGKRVAVLGSGEHAAAEALFLRTYTDKLTLLLPAYSADALSVATRAALDAAQVVVIHVTVGAVSLDDDGVIALAVEDGEIHRFDLAYSAFGTTSQSQLAIDLAAALDTAGRIVVNMHQHTSIAGLYAAGDVVRGLNQICVADGEAAIAATAIHNSLPKPFAWGPETPGSGSIRQVAPDDG